MEVSQLTLKIHRNIGKNRGMHPIDFTTPVKSIKPDVAYGVPQGLYKKSKERL